MNGFISQPPKFILVTLLLDILQNEQNYSFQFEQIIFKHHWPQRDLINSQRLHSQTIPEVSLFLILGDKVTAQQISNFWL